MTHVGPLLSPLLIGRDDLLEVADDRLREAAAGRGHFLLLAGEAGIGKSRLLSAVASRARLAGYSVVEGDVAPPDRDVPAASLLDMARTMVRLPEWAETGRALLELTVDALEAPDARRRMLVYRMVDLLAGSGPPMRMLAFDDLQWTDNLSLEIIAELSRVMRDRPAVIVGAYRSDEVAAGAPIREWRARLITQRMADEMRLEPLNLEQTALMTTLILGTGLPAPRDVVRAVYERTDGVPLHVEELLGALADEERLDSRAIREAAVPDTLEDAILMRIGRLPPEAQAVARAGALIGRCFVPDVLAGIMDVPTEALERPLRQLVDEHVLDAPGVRGLYDFRHQLLRDALYGTLGDGERRRLHARAGEFGKALEGWSQIHASVHYERAGMREQAFRSAVESARAAAEISSHREAADLYRRAVDNMPDEVPVTEQAAVFAALAEESLAIDEIEAASQAAREARSRYLAAGDTVAAALQSSQLINVHRRDARPVSERREEIVRALADVAGCTGPEADRVQAELYAELGIAAFEGLDLAGTRAAIAQAAGAAQRTDNAMIRIWARSYEAAVASVTDAPRDGVRGLGGVAREARSIHAEDAAVTAYRDAAVAAARNLQYDVARELVEDGLRYADAVEQSYCARVMGATAALADWAVGNWDEAVMRGEHALAEGGSERARIMALWPLGYSALSRGEFDTARGYLQKAADFAGTRDIADFAYAAAWGLAELDILAGKPHEAAERTDESLALARETLATGLFAPIIVVGVRARIAARRPSEAGQWLEAAGQLVGDAEWAAPALEHAHGLVQLACGGTTAARAGLERAIELWEQRPRRWEALWARLDLAACLMRSSHFADASALIGQVRESARALRSRPLLERAERLARLAARHTAEKPAWHPLTAREFEVAGLVAQGMTNAQIGADLGISPRTVGAHVEHVLTKLGAARRAEIATWVAARAASGTLAASGTPVVSGAPAASGTPVVSSAPAASGAGPSHARLAGRRPPTDRAASPV
jgi:DNA-binding CsgD family transcriptional regulator